MYGTRFSANKTPATFLTSSRTTYLSCPPEVCPLALKSNSFAHIDAVKFAAVQGKGSFWRLKLKPEKEEEKLVTVSGLQQFFESLFIA